MKGKRLLIFLLFNETVEYRNTDKILNEYVKSKGKNCFCA
jgi:hypothetical protein